MTKIFRVHDAFSVVFEWEAGPLERHSLQPKKEKNGEKGNQKNERPNRLKMYVNFSILKMRVWLEAQSVYG